MRPDAAWQIDRGCHPLILWVNENQLIAPLRGGNHPVPFCVILRVAYFASQVNPVGALFVRVSITITPPPDSSDTNSF